MQLQNFIVREPLLNMQERVVGYELRWQHADATGATPDVLHARQLLQFVAAQLAEKATDAAIGDYRLFLQIPAALLKTDLPVGLPSTGVVFALSQDEVLDDEVIDAMKQLHAQGYGFSFRSSDLSAFDKSLLPLLSYIEVSNILGDFEAQIEVLHGFNVPSSVRIIARDITSWEQFERCTLANHYAFAGNLHLLPRPGVLNRELNPAQTMILQLMEMVRNGEDVPKLEGILKRDAALSYKLLRYINSAGFGLGCEVQSLRHAVTLLGYSPLYRWLGVLLAAATTTGYSPVLMQAAVIRGRFAELLGNSFLPKHDAENLFVTGMFSLLDRLLGMPMDKVLEKIQLSDAVSQALLSREGIYGPFLALAEACELDYSRIEPMATSLCIGANQVNEAHLAAMSWAQALKL
ncbi:EAL and HDOD domain-containing protein [Herbaspirillum sp. GCM10030257]|uniref:EAL and HDOD domain-containing protein n=1 Tax=Herbaspirillum sp. GCM10030257 TaxID=3273393 RepID=UPI003617E1C9